jgi:hypothetical protein
VEAFRTAEEMKATPAAGPLGAFLQQGGWERRFGLARVG